MEIDDIRLVWFIKHPSARLWSVNPYKACGIRCVYCIARSQGKAEPWFNVNRVVGELKHRLAQVPIDVEVGVGAFVDAYPSEEQDIRVTRAVLTELSRQVRPFCINTKSNLVQRDIDILINHKGHCDVFMSLCSLDQSIISHLEPNAPSVAERLQAISALFEAGVDINIDASPWIPGISDIGALLEVLQAEIHIQVGPLDIGHIGSEVRFAGMKFTQEYIDSEYQAHRVTIGNDSRVRWK